MGGGGGRERPLNDGAQPDTRHVPTLDDAKLNGPGRLVVLRGERVGRKIALDQERMLVGRALECDIRFDVPQLSRRHAEILRRDALDYEVVDLQSSNGTFVNGAPVRGTVKLSLGDKIRFGTELLVQLTIHDPIEEQLLQRQRLETLGRLGAGIAHDFNNMLGAVMSNLDYLASLPDDLRLGEGDTRDCLDDIRSASQRASELSQRLVAFARGESHGDAVIDVTAVCAEVGQLVRRTFDRSIDVHTDIARDLRCAGESLELHQVLMNLCLNARDAMPDGGKLTLAARREALPDHEPLGRIVVTVSDTGSGMDDATKAQIFEPFFTTKKGTGFGIGLATVRDMVNLLGGHVTVASSPGAGASFSVVLPEASRPSARRVTSTVRNKLELPRGAPLTIMLIDDEQMVRRSMRRVLEQAGHEVVEANNGSEALALLAAPDARRPDVVILDVDMPGMTGEETLVALLAADPRAVVLMTSGHRNRIDEDRLRQLGARGFVHKPWRTPELLRSIDDISGEPDTLDDGSNLG